MWMIIKIRDHCEYAILLFHMIINLIWCTHKLPHVRREDDAFWRQLSETGSLNSFSEKCIKIKSHNYICNEECKVQDICRKRYVKNDIANILHVGSPQWGILNILKIKLKATGLLILKYYLKIQKQTVANTNAKHVWEVYQIVKWFWLSAW